MRGTHRACCRRMPGDSRAVCRNAVRRSFGSSKGPPSWLTYQQNAARTEGSFPCICHDLRPRAVNFMNQPG